MKTTTPTHEVTLDDILPFDHTVCSSFRPGGNKYILATVSIGDVSYEVFVDSACILRTADAHEAVNTYNLHP